MLEQNVALRSVIDLLIIGGVLFAQWTFLNHKLLIQRLGSPLLVRTILTTISLFGLVFVVDLSTLHLLPVVLQDHGLLSRLLDLQRHYSRFGLLIGIAGVICGLSYLLHRLFPELLKVIERLEKTQLQLEEECLEAKQTETSLRVKTETAMALFNAPIDDILFINSAGEIVDANAAFCNRFKKDRSEIIGGSVFQYFPRNVLHKRRATFMRVLEERRPLRFEERIDRKWMDVLLYPLINDQKLVDQVIVISRDITSRVQYEEGLLETQRNLEKSQHDLEAALRQQKVILNNTNSGIAFLKRRRFIWGNSRLWTMFGYSESECLGETTKFLYANPDDFERLGKEAYPTLVQECRYEGEYQMRRKDASTFWCKIYGRAIDPDDLSQGSIWELEDITRRRSAEEGLRRSEENFRCLAEDSPLGILACDENGVVQYSNSPLAEIFPLIVDGNNEPINVLTKQELIEMGLSDLLRICLAEGIRNRTDFHFPVTNDGTRYLSCIATPLHRRAESISGAMMIFEDVTDQKMAQLEREQYHIALERQVEERTAKLQIANEELRTKNQELESLDALKNEFVATVSHELRTPLASILGYADTLAECNLPESQRVQFTEVIIEEAERLGGLINNILDLSSLDRGTLDFHFNWHYFDEVVQRAVKSVEGLILEKKGLRIETASNEIHCCGDEERLTQVMINLLGNAIKFSPDVGVIRVKTTAEEGGFVVTVSDQGPGIPPDRLEDVFKKFHQIKRHRVLAKGTGLGLAISKSIIDAHGGAIWAENTKDGAMFCFRLPYQQEIRI